MFIASIGGLSALVPSFAGGVPVGEVSGISGMSIIIGVAEADGRAFGSLVLSGFGDVVLGDGAGRIDIPGIGAIVA